MATFRLNRDQEEEFIRWKHTIDAKIIELQRKTMDKEEFEEKTHNGLVPYTTLSQGVYTFSFTPTQVGTFVQVKESCTKDTIDLSCIAKAKLHNFFQ